MGLFNNVGKYSDIHEYIKNFNQQTQSGLKLDVNNNYDIEGKRLANVGQGVDADDAVVMHQMTSLDTGLETKFSQLKADSLQVDGSSHMTGDLDLRGQKLINPGEIEMNRKLITNLDTDEDNDLSAVNIITLKKFHPAASEPTHEVTKDIDLKELFNVVQSKQQTYHDLGTHYDNLVSYNDVKNIFLSRKDTFPMETALDMGNQTIFNVKDPTVDDQGVNKGYVDKFLPLSGGTMTNELSMGGNKITNIAKPTRDADAATKKFVVVKTNKCLLLAGGTMTGPINMGGNKVANAATPTNPTDAATKFFVEKETQKCLSLGGGTMTGNLDMNSQQINNIATPTREHQPTPKSYVDSELNLKIGSVVVDMLKTEEELKKYVNESHITSTSHPKDAFRYLMDEVDESSSVHDMEVTGITDFSNSPHHFNKKAYDLKITKDHFNEYDGRLGFNMYKLPEGEYTVCVEFFPASMDGVSVNVVSTSLNINQQSTKKFSGYSRSIIHVHKWKITEPEFIYLDLKWKGTAESPSKGDANLIIYGIAGSQPDVESSVYDSPFVFKGGKMVMETDLDLNNHQILNSNLKNNFMLIGRFRKSGNEINILFDNYFNDIVIPIRCKLIKVYSQFLSKTSSFPQLTLTLPKKASQSGTNFSSDNRIQTFTFSNVVYREGEFFLANIKVQSGDIVGAAQITFLFEIV